MEVYLVTEAIPGDQVEVRAVFKDLTDACSFAREQAQIQLGDKAKDSFDGGELEYSDDCTGYVIWIDEQTVN